jgi:nucleoside-diphosphate-sugar epimerase
VAKIVTNELGYSELIQFGERPSLTQDADRVVANVGRLKEELKWKPLYSLEEGIKEMIEYRSQFIKK